MTSRLPIADFDLVTAGDDYMYEEQKRLNCFSEAAGHCHIMAVNTQRPNEVVISRFSESNGALVSSPISVRAAYNPKDKYDLNWTSLADYSTNWDILSYNDKLMVNSLVASDLTENRNRFGLKRLNLETHLLLNIGCDMTNIVNNGKSSILSNLRSHKGKYSSECLDNKTVDAKSALRSGVKFLKDRSVETLFSIGLVAYQAVISSDDSLRSITGLEETRENYHSFFKSNSSYLSKLANKSKKIYSYLYSHEISVDSILAAKYRPHTHVMFFLPAEGYRSEEREAEIKMLEEKFNSSFSDRKISVLREESGDCKVGRKFKDVERAVQYLFRAYSLSEQYMREIRSSNVRELNKATVECYHNLVFFFKGGIRRNQHSMIPSRKSAADFKHPLLQNKKKKGRIVKKKDIKDETIPRRKSKSLCSSFPEQRAAIKQSEFSMAGAERHAGGSGELRSEPRRVLWRRRQADVRGESSSTLTGSESSASSSSSSSSCTTTKNPSETANGSSQETSKSRRLVSRNESGRHSGSRTGRQRVQGGGRTQDRSPGTASSSSGHAKPAKYTSAVLPRGSRRKSSFSSQGL